MSSAVSAGLCQPAVAVYQWNEEKGSLPAIAIEVLALDGDRVAESTGFLDPDLFLHFGLPAELPPPV